MVTFPGEVISGLPEDGGVLPIVIEPAGPPVTAEAFRTQHWLVPHEEEQLPAADLFAGLDIVDAPPADA